MKMGKNKNACNQNNNQSNDKISDNDNVRNSHNRYNNKGIISWSRNNN